MKNTRRIRKLRWCRRVALAALSGMLFQALVPPAIAIAASGGGTQAEYAPVAGGNRLVDPFTGTFRYHIPLFNLPGSPEGTPAFSLDYTGGSTPYSPIGWVGQGWSLNTGAIARQRNGVPDDFNGEQVRTWTQQRGIQSMSIVPKEGLRIFGDDKKDIGGLSAAQVFTWNSVTGWSFKSKLSADAGIGGYLNMTASYDEDAGPAAGANAEYEYGGATVGAGVGVNSDGATAHGSGAYEGYGLAIDSDGHISAFTPASIEIAKVDSRQTIAEEKAGPKYLLKGSKYTLRTKPRPFPLPQAPYTGFTGGFELNVQGNLLPVPIGLNAGINIHFSQKNFESERPLQAYGFMYSESARVPKDAMMDFSKEKDGPYSPRQKFSPIPLPTPDQFALSGPGIGGSMRLQSAITQQYKVATVESHMIGLPSLGLNIEAGNAFGAAPTVNASYKRAKNRGRIVDTLVHEEPVFFRLNDEAVRPHMPDEGDADPDSRAPRATYIAYRTNAELEEALQFGAQQVPGYRGFTRPSEVPGIDRADLPDDGIGEIAVFTPQGMEYDYGLPVYARNELEMSLSIEHANQANVEIEPNHRVYLPANLIPSDADLFAGTPTDVRNVIRGTATAEPYASTFLLTALKDADYLDRSLDGPTPDDFGHYLKYDYKRVMGGDNAWFKWRRPYTGFYHVASEAYDDTDDLATMRSGEKELWYPKAIRTKTHIALFSTSPRLDQLEAWDNQLSGPLDDADRLNQDFRARQHKLDTIHIYALEQGSFDGNGDFQPDAGERPLQRIHFAYDYTLSANMPDSRFDGGENPQRGVLTLRKVWFEYNGVQDPFSAPYKFTYAYLPAAQFELDHYLPGPRIGEILAHNDAAAGPENPPYDSYALDRWGHAQDPVAARMRMDRGYLWNSPAGNDASDPGAWQLKQIRLPDGGEIHVQYDAHQYRFVQDKSAMVMGQLQAPAGNAQDRLDAILESRYHLDLAQLGNANDAGKKADLLSELRARFSYRHDAAGADLPANADPLVDRKEKLYFRFRFQVNPESGQEEDFEGFCNVLDVRDVPGSIEFVLGSFEFESGQIANTPRGFAQKLITKYMKHKAIRSFGHMPEDGAVEQLKEFAYKLVGFITGGIDDFAPGDLCKKMDYTRSFVRIPPLEAKTVGGPRVFRVLFYDKGVTDIAGDNALYGREYRYTDAEGQCSGVATYEPLAGKYSNPLYQLNHRFQNEFYGKCIGYLDLPRLTHPLGESLMPGASIGYAEVTTSDIIHGQTNTGFTRHEFYTLKDRPYLKAEATRVRKPRGGLDDTPLINLVLGSQYFERAWRYSFDIENIHGRLRSVATYAGHPDDEVHHETSRETFTWCGTEERQATPEGEIKLGETAERVKEYNRILETSVSGMVKIEPVLANLGPLGIWPIPFSKVDYESSENRLITNLQTDIRRIPVLAKRRTIMRNGIEQHTDYVQFDAATGQALITAIDDEYAGAPAQAGLPDKRYYSHETPAYQVYSAMGPRYDAEGRTYATADGDTFRISIAGQTGDITVVSQDICALRDRFSPGDLLEVLHAGQSAGIVQLYDVRADVLNFELTERYPENLAAIGADPVDLRVLRSGKTNQLAARAGKTVVYQASPDLATTALNAPTLNERQDFVDQLNPLYDQAMAEMAGPNPQAIDISLPNHPAIACLPCTPVIRYNVAKQGLELIDDCNQNEICTLPRGEGDFFLDSATGDLMFRPLLCPAEERRVLCLLFCTPLDPVEVQNVVAADARKYDDYWDIENSPAVLERYSRDAPLTGNKFEKGTRGKWRLANTYGYKTEVQNLMDGDRRLYDDAGLYTSFVPFDWKFNRNDPQHWIPGYHVQIYAPDGMAVETYNAMGIPSTEMPAYNNSLTQVTATNARVGDLLFESFEKGYPTGLESGLDPGNAGALISDRAHSGDKAWSLGNQWLPIRRQSLDNTDDFVLKCWVMHESNAINVAPMVVDTAFVELQMQNPLNGHVRMVEPSAVTQVGHWALVEFPMRDIKSQFGGVINEIDLSLQLSSQPGRVAYLDDLLLAPLEAQVNASVVSPRNLEVIATFGPSHFATYYQYDAEGRLLREVIETEAGLKTVSENHYHRIENVQQ